MSDVKLVLGTMTFGESAFNPMVKEFVNSFLNLLRYILNIYLILS